MEIPDKPYLRIGEVARLLGTHTHVLRYWESCFPQLKPVRAASGQRLFHPSDLETLLIIKTLLHEEGYTIAGAKRRLDELSGEAQSEREGMVDQLRDELSDILKMLD
ncbi:MAG: MerR family transcriptional regulator [Desulfarculaceae bacterium]|nr:MerR family transcriptional regulator [Desulfarculaceae bacterium]MCF8070953.1 MerR family transcriptional regulator [Desulfarculaceae bacterium]MCF8100541.1 MerR family transcriptional regulator [Desulfarculaceae bacterium]MCF8116567.1 MerR family transcriptional regulator [Desulfarculaceae bacterium]